MLELTVLKSRRIAAPATAKIKHRAWLPMYYNYNKKKSKLNIIFSNILEINKWFINEKRIRCESTITNCLENKTDLHNQFNFQDNHLKKNSFVNFI